MAKLSANGVEIYRLERIYQFNKYILLSIRSNGVVLKAARTIDQGKQTTSRWKVALTRTAARTINLTTPELLRDYYSAKGFTQGGH